MTALEIRKGITEKQFSAIDVVTALFERICEKEPLVDGFLTLGRGEAPVSYTHLRAHETVLDLVCRLLLEKKNKKNKTKANPKLAI